MALIKCPECKKKISDQCEKCPNCGYPIDKICEADENQITDIENVDDGTARGKKSFDIKSLLKKWWFLVAVGAVIVAIAVTTILLLNRDTKPKFDKDGKPMFVELTNEVYTNAEDYLGYHINIKGKVFQVMSDNGNVKGIQVWLDPDTCEQNMMIYYNADVKVKQGDYIMCSGYIDSVTEYKNAYDAKLYAPLVISSDLVKATYIDVMSPTTATITPENLKQEKYGYSISIDKIEFAEKETRVYATVQNNGKALLNFGDAVIVQNGKQYNSTDNYEADYDEIPYEIVKGVSSSGIILFPAISTNDFELTIDIHSDDYDEEIDEFVFKVSKNSTPQDKPEETKPTKTPNKSNEKNKNKNNTVNNSSVNSTTTTTSSKTSNNSNTTNSSNTSSTSSASSGGNGSSNSQNNSSSAVSSTTSTANPPAQSESESDEKWIANRVLELLNEERQKIGVHTRQSFPGLTKIAEMRAEQLTVNFSHSWTDENGKTWTGSKYVATQLKYGKFIDATLFGDPPEYSYYDYGAGGENISGGGGYTNEQIAQSIVDNFKGSSGHWQSLMSAENYYDGIGIAYGQNPQYPGVYWWCSINSAAQNLYG